MVLIVVYLALMITGDVLAYFIGFVVEQPDIIGFGDGTPAKTASLTVFLVAYFLNLWLAWVLAVKLTAPRDRAALST
jgi:hypothetical protein